MTVGEAQALLDEAVAEARMLVDGAESGEALEELRRQFLGKRSPVARVNESIKDLPPTERPTLGKAVGAYREAVSALLEARGEALGARARPAGEQLDLTAGGHGRCRGHLHLVSQVRRELEDVFVGLGFRVAEGPEVELDWYNFEALNMPPAHPARDMQDTIYVELGEPQQVLLRTHTSAVQARVMESQAPPVYIVVPGRTFRKETLDARHSPMFHQIEGLVVDRGITMADLFGTIEAFTQTYFGPAIHARFRPDFFPYTEPSAEFAVTCIFCEGAGCTVCSRTGWIELGGCGMVDPNVFGAVGYDPEEFTGFAFGFGLERMAMIRFGVDRIRTFFDNDFRFLRQF
jgi:phenylalanyl-tRNA synthetase alpha chain